jgi:hypothetical protein
MRKSAVIDSMQGIAMTAVIFDTHAYIKEQTEPSVRKERLQNQRDDSANRDGHTPFDRGHFGRSSSIFPAEKVNSLSQYFSQRGMITPDTVADPHPTDHCGFFAPSIWRSACFACLWPGVGEYNTFGKSARRLLSVISHPVISNHSP